jgi:tRNA pseudouridine38-40 synthase
MNRRRVALGVRYDGSAYHGWQRQDDLPTVQLSLEQALSRVANHPVKVTCAGRTDAGVHASAQVVHFDTDADRNDYSWVFGANSNLPADVRVIWAKFVPDDFHARFSATARRYRYVLYNHEIRPGILRHFVGWYHRPLDEKSMQEGAQHLLGEHDFSAFRGAGCQAKHPVRTIHAFSIQRQRRMLLIEIQANAFLLHMVRNIVGSLLQVACGEQPSDWIRTVLESRDRREGGVTISPRGLYLVSVDYPETFQLPETPIGPFFLP